MKGTGMIDLWSSGERERIKMGTLQGGEIWMKEQLQLHL
jgi:hypothetical protein